MKTHNTTEEFLIEFFCFLKRERLDSKNGIGFLEIKSFTDNNIISKPSKNNDTNFKCSYCEDKKFIIMKSLNGNYKPTKTECPRCNRF